MKIYLEGKCNNNCIFCKINKVRQSFIGDVKQKIESFDSRKDRRIVFTGAESTVRKDFLDLLSFAKGSNAEFIQLNTNGRMFSDIIFAKKIIEAGANYFKISLHGHNSGLHDQITQTPRSFSQTIRGVKNLIRLNQRDNIVIVTVVNSLNFKHLHNILDLARRLKIKKVQLNAVKTNNRNLCIPLEEIAKRITKIRGRYLFNMFIKTKGIPYCLMPNPEILFLRGINRKDYTFLDACKDCKYNAICPGVLKSYAGRFGISGIAPVLDFPVEVMIEVESRCNFDCEFCFNRISFASHGFGGQKLETSYVKEIIDSIKDANISTVRFTGGEPMLREDFFELIQYAKSKGLRVRLNTNGSLIESFKMVKEMVKYLDYVLFGMHAYNAKGDEKITGYKESFEKKIRAMRWFKKAGIEILRVNTIASLDNIKNLKKFYNLFRRLKVDRWAINRLIPFSKENKPWGEKEASLLVEKLIKIKKDKVRRKLSMWIHIVNAIPLCAADPVRVSSVSSGGRAVDGHERFAVDPRRFAKPIYYMNKNIGDPLKILKCWNHSFMKSMRDYKMLPNECKNCFLLDRCKGGNRFCALIAGDSYSAADPLMNYAKIKRYIW